MVGLDELGNIIGTQRIWQTGDIIEKVVINRCRQIMIFSIKMRGVDIIVGDTMTIDPGIKEIQTL